MAEQTTVELIFLKAIDLAGAERAAFLERACGDDLPLRADVEAMIRAAANAENYFAGLGERIMSAGRRSLAGAPTGCAAEALEGLQIGPYRLTGPIARGGMGTVWRARRVDGRFEGEVAVKLLNLAAGAVAAQRFELEGRYLARLSHPNIARLLDAGVGPMDQPYLILELVEGTTIDRYCDDRHLDIRQRVKLFLTMLDAVAHAHARLIVHRDIKPSNVMVTGDGVVKLLDFGIAKLLSADSDATANGVTREFGTVLTPGYAAPEQMLAAEVTTATDVYALGLLLFRLLTGHHARRIVEVPSLDELRVLAGRAPPRLVAPLKGESAQAVEALGRQRQLSSAGLHRALSDDLDTIVRKAMAVEPRDRYQSIGALIADLRRYLDDKPVAAQVDSVGYRVGKFLKRHRTAVATAAVLLLTLSGSAIVATIQGIEARRQRNAALEQQQRVQASNEFLTLLLEEIGPDGGLLTPIDLLDRGVEMLDQRDPGEGFVGRMLYNLAQRYSRFGATDKTLQLLRRAQSLARGQDDADLLAAALCASTRPLLLQAVERARSQVAEARRVLDRLEAPSPDTLVACARAEALIQEADGSLGRAIRLLQRTRAELDDRARLSTYLSGLLLDDLSELYFKLDQLEHTLALNDEIRALSRDSGREGTLSFLTVELDRATILHNMGEITNAFEIRQQALDRVSELEQGGHVMPEFWSAYAASLIRLSRYEEVLPILDKNRRRAQELGNLQAQAQADLQMGRALMRMGNYPEAVHYLDAAESVFRQAEESRSRSLRLIALARARVTFGIGQHSTGLQMSDALLSGLGYPERFTSPGLKNALRVAARLALESGNGAKAAALASDYYEMAVAAARDPQLSGDVGQALLFRAGARQLLGRLEAARDDLVRAHTALENGFGADHPETLQAAQLLSLKGMGNR